MRYLLRAVLPLAVLCVAFAAGIAFAHTGPAPHFNFAPVTLGQVVLTDEGSASAPSLSSKLSEFLSPGGVGALLSVVLSALGGLMWFTKRRKELVALAAYHAFHIVEDVGEQIEGDDAFDKTARYLKELDAFMVKNGWRPLKPGEVEVAKALAQSLHGQEVAKVKAAVAAAEASP